mgnify:CR=1 FL=1
MAKAGASLSDATSVSSGNTPDTSANGGPRDDRYVVVARRYRPRSFDQLVGQQHVGQALCNAIETGRVGHAYLFTGARGVGKTSTARIFAKALNDPGGPTCTPDSQSDVAQAIDAGEDVDVVEIDGASNRGIDDIRALRAGVSVRPSRSRYKIYIIDEVHMLSRDAFNALLKTLEEPPPHVKFIFCTTDPEKLPITVLSRCQRFDFAPVQTDSIMGRLREIVDAEQLEAEDEALRLIARRAEGSMRDSQSLLEQVVSFSSGKLTLQTVHAILGTADDARLHELGQALASGDAAQALALVDRACGEGVAAGQLTEQLLGYFRDVLTATVGCPPQMQRHTGESLHGELRTLGQRWGLQTVLAIVGMIDHALDRIRHSLHGRVLLEATLIQICHLPDLQKISDVAASLGDGGRAVPASRPTAPRAADEEKKKLEPLAAAAGSALPASGAGQGAGPVGGIPPATPVGPARASSQPPVPAANSAGVSPTVGNSAPTFGPAIHEAKSGPAIAPGLRSGGVSGTMQPHGSHGLGSSAAQPARESVPPPAAKTRAQRLREIEHHPYVKACLDTFGAEIVKIDPPRPGTGPTR